MINLLLLNVVTHHFKLLFLADSTGYSTQCFFVAGEIYELFIIASLLRFLLSGQKFWPPLLHFGESDRIRMIDRFISFARTRSLDDLSRDAHLRVARSDVHRDLILTLVFFKLKKGKLNQNSQDLFQSNSCHI